FAGVLEHYRNIRPVVMEAGASWLTWLLWRMDEQWHSFGPDAEYTPALAPSAYFRRQCFVVMGCAEEAAVCAPNLGDNLLISADYPNFGSAFPDAIRSFVDLESIGRQSKQKILWNNAARLFGLAEMG